ncbi:MAG: hydrogenase maturation protease [Planctomycetota bacterium]
MSDGATPPVLVLALGNMLLRDDGFGLVLLEQLRERLGGKADLELVDGGTQGIALVGLLSGRRAVLVLDAVARGAPPGTVHVIDDAVAEAPPRGGTAHEGNAGDLLAAAALIGDLPPVVRVVGVEPEVVRTGTGLSDTVASALPEALRAAEATAIELLQTAA